MKKTTRLRAAVPVDALACSDGWLWFTYEDLQNVDFINESRIVLELFLLDGFDGVLLLALAMLCQVDDTEATICELLLE